MNNNDYLDLVFKNHKNAKTYSFKILSVVVFSYYYHNKFGWFRIFGKGFKWKNVLIHSLTFSERNGYEKGVVIGNWRIGLLRKN